MAEIGNLMDINGVFILFLMAIYLKLIERNKTVGEMKVQ